MMSSSTSPTTLRLGTRGSPLARMQSQLVADGIEKLHPGVKVELQIFKTSGDQIAERPLHAFGGKGLFTREIEQALLDRQIDFAVHSFKDVPVTMPLVDQSELVFAAVPKREDPSDVLICEDAKSLQDLPAGARIGTGSLRRRCQILALRPDLHVEPVRGNIDTRLKKQKEGQFDAIVLAMAGLRRAGLYDQDRMSVIPTEQLLPAPGQGALALQCRRDDEPTRRFLVALNDEPTALCVEAERAIVQALQGDCHSPIAALAVLADQTLQLRAAVGGRDGTPPVLQASATAERDRFQRAVEVVLADLTKQGARELLKEGADASNGQGCG